MNLWPTQHFDRSDMSIHRLSIRSAQLNRVKSPQRKIVLRRQNQDAASTRDRERVING